MSRSNSTIRGPLDWRCWLLLAWVLATGAVYLKAMSGTRWGVVVEGILRSIADRDPSETVRRL